MATKEKSAPKPRKPRKRAGQPFLSEEMAPLKIEEVDAEAEEYISFRNQRMNALKLEVEHGENLLALLHKHNLAVYDFDGYMVSIKTLEKVSAKRKKDKSGENGEE